MSRESRLNSGEVLDKMYGAGYKGICIEEGKFVPDEDAFDYAIERIAGGSKEEKDEFVEWFYSGNWIREEDGGNAGDWR